MPPDRKLSESASRDSLFAVFCVINVDVWDRDRLALHLPRTAVWVPDFQSHTAGKFGCQYGIDENLLVAECTLEMVIPSFPQLFKR